VRAPLEAFGFAADAVLPVFLLLALGHVLHRSGRLDPAFLRGASWVVYRLCLPVTIFVSISAAPLADVWSLPLLLLTGSLTVAACLLLWPLSARLAPAAADRGVFIQGAFRSNFAIVGLALVDSALGAGGLAQAGLLLALIIPLYTVLAVTVLRLPLQVAGDPPGRLLRPLLTNPLLIAVAAGLLASGLGWRLGGPLAGTADALRAMTLPLALLTVGATLDLRALRLDSTPALAATGIKLVLLPLLAVALALALGRPAAETAILFVLFGSPTAVVSFVLAHELGGNPVLAANIVALTTLLSVATLGLGLFALRLAAIV